MCCLSPPFSELVFRSCGGARQQGPVLLHLDGEQPPALGAVADGVCQGRMDGVQFDLATDRYEATFLFSRLSNPGGGSTGDREVLRTNNTILAGWAVGSPDWRLCRSCAAHGQCPPVAHLARQAGWQPIRWLADHRAEQNHLARQAGAARRLARRRRGWRGVFFPMRRTCRSPIAMARRNRGKAIGFEPIIEGGFLQQGFVAANGPEGDAGWCTISTARILLIGPFCQGRNCQGRIPADRWATTTRSG